MNFGLFVGLIARCETLIDEMLCAPDTDVHIGKQAGLRIWGEK